MKVEQKKYSGKDVLLAAREMMKKELEQMQGRPLTDKENAKMDQVASGLSYEVLKDMGVVR
jgi:hypothetical protein